MAVPVSQYELEALPELEAGYGAEATGEMESEQFFGAVANLATRGWERAKALGQAAGRAVLRVLSGPGTGVPVVPVMPVGRAYRDCPNASKPADCYGRCGIGGVCGWTYGKCRCLGSARETEAELSPIRRIYPDAMMEHLGHVATATQSEAEAEALAGAMIPLVARAIPAAAPAIMRATPGLACGLAGVVRTLRRSPATRPLVRTVPAIVRNTAASIAQQSSQGTPVMPQAAVRTLARQTVRMLGNPQQAARAFKRSRALDRHFHRGGAGPVCPSCGAVVR